MSDQVSTRPDDARALRFACSCASAADVSDDPWTIISKQAKLNDGTKELVLNATYRRPRTITQLAQQLGLSQPAVHRHVAEMLSSELLREVAVPEEERGWVVERYYGPNFPVVLSSDRREFDPILEALAEQLAEAFRRRQDDLAEAFSRTSLPERGVSFETLAHYLYTAVARMARKRLEEEGVLPAWPEHRDGSRWVWWAEEPPEEWEE